MLKFSEDNERLADPSKCAYLRAQLKMCMLETDCCKIEKRTPRECLQTHHNSVPDECYILLQGFFDCKHSTFDRRRQFRGAKGSNT